MFKIFLNRAVYEAVEIHGTGRQATDDNRIRRRENANFTPNN